MDARLHSEPFELNGKTYNLVCNMNVLADVQEAYEGNIMTALNTIRGIRSTLTFLAAMLNDSADTNGWSERFSARELGRTMTMKQVTEIGSKIFPLVAEAITGDMENEEPEVAEAAEEDTAEKN